MGLPKLWGKDKSGSQGFVFSHVKTIYYNWASKILLKTKLDEMDALIDAKIAKAMMSNQQVNDANKVPTSALTYSMGQNISKNADDIAEINGKFLPQYYVSNFDTSPNGSNMCIMTGGRTNPEGKPSGIGGNNCCVIHYGNSNYEGQLAFGFGKNAIARRNKNGSAEWSPWDYVALKSDLPTLERIHCTFFNDTSLRGEISKDIVNAAFVAPVAYNSIGVKVKQVYRTGKTIILFGESFSNTDSLDISVICY